MKEKGVCNTRMELEFGISREYSVNKRKDAQIYCDPAMLYIGQSEFTTWNITLELTTSRNINRL